MIDNFALGLTHALMLWAAWLMLTRPELDREDVESHDRPAKRNGWRGRG